MESNANRDDVERIKTLYEGTGDGREPFWSSDNWGPLISEIQFGEGQFRDLLIEAMREHGITTADMAGLSVVELGCGWGRNLHQFVELGIPARNIAGVDLIENFIAFGKSQNPASTLPLATPRERNSAIVRLTSSCFTRCFPPSPSATFTQTCCGKPGGWLDPPVSSSCSTLPIVIRSAEPTSPAKKLYSFSLSRERRYARLRPAPD